MKYLLTGATGFVGKVLVSKLLAGGDEVSILSRNPAAVVLSFQGKCKGFMWSDMNSVPPAEAFENVDVVINLMGEGVAEKRWTEDQKKKIYDSRINGTKKLIEQIAMLKQKPKTFISASAIGIYGTRNAEELTEESSLGADFLATVCKDWETETFKAQNLGLRTAVIRIGVVLGKNGGALSKMLPIFKLGAGGPLGSGKQVMSWIHIEDLASMFIFVAKNNQLKGIFNGTSPSPKNNKEFSKILGSVLKRPAFAPAPGFMMKLAFGEMSVILLEGQKVLPKNMEKAGFEFKFPSLENAFKNILN
jgi:uncharacterized protein (TIGR01777 family)